MPYKVKKRGDGYKVTTPNHPQGFSKKPLSKEKAEKQQAAIYANTHGESFLRQLDAVLESLDNDEHERKSDIEFGDEQRKTSVEKKAANRQRRISAADQRDELRAEKRFNR